VGQVAEPVISHDRHAADIAVALSYDSTTKRAMDTASGALRRVEGLCLNALAVIAAMREDDFGALLGR